jgi:nicotinate-nucleotide adenylyltransferase
MIKNAIKGHKFFSVSTFENTSENISFTIDTVYYFKKKFKSRSLRIIMGEDNFYSFTSWYKYADILSSVNIIVLSRDNIERYGKIDVLKKYIEENINLFNQAKSGKIHFSTPHKSDISATTLRQMIKQDESFKNYVSRENCEYIEKNGLYK